MNKTEFIAAVADKSDFSRRQADKAVSAVVEVISELLIAGDKLQLPGFGTFCVNERAAREGRNPRTGDVIQIPSAKVPAFKPSKVLKASLNGELVEKD